ncbi:tigger transposable element-derived protein 1 [Trichonephila clavipes]|nr:tigger transposable element-derived protein 1 [Trichonephila clavipes]
MDELKIFGISSRHHIDDFIRGRIIGKIEEVRKITHVAREFDIAHSVVSRLWKSFKTTGMCSRRHGGGRVRSTTPAEDRYIVLSAKRNRHTTAQQHRTARLQWCREHQNWTEQDWACVLFSNESRFSLSSDCRRQLIWRGSGTAYRPENIQEKDRYPTCSIMVRAGIMINGRTRLHVVVIGTMTGQRYIDEVLLPHDCLDSEGIQRLAWPARSRNQNPIENVWDALGRQVADINYPPTNKNTLIRALTEEWDKLPQQLQDNVVQNNRGECDSEGASKIFPEELAKIIEDGDYSADQVFNADETGLYWKKLPNRTYIAKDEKTASGHKASKDRVTLLLCSNASGDRMLKPLLISKSLRPRALKGKDLKQLPVHWMVNSKAWIPTAIFTEWFNNCFVPEVEDYMKEKSLDFKVLLIVDNAASHPQLEHPNVQLVLLPPNTTSLIQPLDQGIFVTFKKYYIKTTYKFILNRLENECNFKCLLEKLWPTCMTNNTTTQTSTLSDEIINLAHEIGGDGFNTFSHDDIDELLVDNALSDNDIIDLTLDLTVDGVVGLEGDNDEEEKSTPLTGIIIQEGLQLCSKLENHFIINDPNSERASEFQRELQNCMSGYRELYKKIKESSSQSVITDYIVKKERATQKENEICENPWPLPQISIAETVSSDDEGDLELLHKRCKPLSDNDNH